MIAVVPKDSDVPPYRDTIHRLLTNVHAENVDHACARLSVPREQMTCIVPRSAAKIRIEAMVAAAVEYFSKQKKDPQCFCERANQGIPPTANGELDVTEKIPLNAKQNRKSARPYPDASVSVGLPSAHHLRTRLNLYSIRTLMFGSDGGVDPSPSVHPAVAADVSGDN